MVLLLGRDVVKDVDGSVVVVVVDIVWLWVNVVLSVGRLAWKLVTPPIGVVVVVVVVVSSAIVIKEI